MTPVLSSDLDLFTELKIFKRVNTSSPVKWIVRNTWYRKLSLDKFLTKPGLIIPWTKI